MELQRGQIVRALKGRDKENFLIILAVEPPYVHLCDGKRRPLELPKRKKAFHTAETRSVVNENSLKTNRQIRAALRNFREGVEIGGN